MSAADSLLALESGSSESMFPPVYGEGEVERYAEILPSGEVLAYTVHTVPNAVGASSCAAAEVRYPEDIYPDQQAAA
jgi:hypothetical protein